MCSGTYTAYTQLIDFMQNVIHISEGCYQKLGDVATRPKHIKFSKVPKSPPFLTWDNNDGFMLKDNEEVAEADCSSI